MFMPYPAEALREDIEIFEELIIESELLSEALYDSRIDKRNPSHLHISFSQCSLPSVFTYCEFKVFGLDGYLRLVGIPFRNSIGMHIPIMVDISLPPMPLLISRWLSLHSFLHMTL
mgnify:CR=1 FL=1